MPARKIVDEQEVARWFEEGRTYRWMCEEYLRKYNIQTVPSMWGNYRRTRGLDRRIERNDDLIPWEVLPHHRYAYLVQMLRAEGRRRGGFELRAKDAKYLPGFLADLEERNVVVHYDPDLEDGFVYVPREPTDTDIIRRPKKGKTTKRRRAE